MLFISALTIALLVLLLLSWGTVPREHRKMVVLGDLGVVCLAVLLGAFVGGMMGIAILF